MAKKQMLFKTKGMNQDLSVSAFNPEFSFENMNLRLSTNENNTTLSWVNEKGTALILSDNEDHDPILLEGTPIGTAVINHTLVIFTTNNHGEEAQESNSDYIYKLEPTPTKEYMTLTRLYNGNLKFSTEYPIETIGSYEADHIQKVYWTDGKEQPRVINIVGNIKENADTQFDFIPEVSFKGSVSITQTNNSGGIFAPGVIQYCIAYYNRYRQQSNIIYVSPLYYLGANNRGASPEEKVNVSFTLTISNPDDKFDYIRLYSVQRTSLNGTPIVKLLEDLEIRNAENNQLKYTDYGTTGSSMDPTELLFIGGKEISVLTMTDKDGTLFMGNITEYNTLVDSLQDYFLKHEANIQFETSPDDSGIKVFNQKHTKELYPYESTLKYNQEVQSTFKGGEYYRFGFQLQKKTGEWSEPIYLNDEKNNIYPEISSSALEQQGVKYKLAYAKTAINFGNIGIDISDYVQVRPLVVFPNIGDREVLCQGVINPTVFNVEDRLTGSPYSQASWFFRPFGFPQSSIPPQGTQPEIAARPQSKHYASLHDYSEYAEITPIKVEEYNYFRKASMIEVQGAVKTRQTPYDLSTPTVQSNTQFFVDQSIVTLNSPDIEFDTEVQNSPMDGLKLRIVGTIPIDSSASSHSIVTSSGKLHAGFNLETGYGEYVDKIYGEGELEYNTFYFNGQSMRYGTHMIAANIWNDGFALNCAGDADYWYPILESDTKYYRNSPMTNNVFEQEGDYALSSHAYPVRFFVHPWNRNASVNNDYRNKDAATSILKTKRMSNILFSLNSKYLTSQEGIIEYGNISAGLHLTENDHIYKIGLPKQKERSASISYYPNIDKILNNSDGIKVIPETFTEKDGGIRYSLENVIRDGQSWTMNQKVYDPIPMKYKSTSHIVIAFNALQDNKIPILPEVTYNTHTDLNTYTHPGAEGQYNTYWGDQDMQFSMNGSIDVSHTNVLLLGELYYEKDSDVRFGGKGKEAFKSNTWTVGGNAVPINTQGDTTLVWSIGDTYFQRYDCLKTYAYTPEDVNQVVEILSFMCETHVNIDGRYDNNRGESTNHSMNPNNFNLLNDAYSQKDNFFSYKKSNTEDEHYRYPNWVAYSKKKESGADIDLWTNVTLGSVLEFDGDKGEVQKLTKFGDQILAFQDSLLSQIMFNANVQISSTQGVPIEIANSGKVDGKRSLSDNIGCSNKWSVVNTPSGVYFMDSNNKGIYMYNGQINNLSGTLGFNSWCKKNIPSSNVKWDPYNFNNFVGHYDKLNQEILYINGSTALAYNERLNAFTSFYDYGDTPWFCNLDDVGLWIRKDASIWQHQAGEYCDFFSTDDYDGHKPYGMTLVGNPEPQIDKIFTNIEFRACVEGDGVLGNNEKFTFSLPFNSLETWNEYQHGITALEIKNGHSAMVHGGDSSALKRKFRIWRCDIPRDNVDILTVEPERPTPPIDMDDWAKYLKNREKYEKHLEEVSRGIFRTKAHTIDRMRNPWLYLKFQKDADTDKKVEIHDIVMTYFT